MRWPAAAKTWISLAPTRVSDPDLLHFAGMAMTL
jgi:hypothetical protein